MHFFAESFAGIKKTSYLCIRKREIPILASVKDGPFVYRLGRKIFILPVRLSVRTQDFHS